MARLCRRFHWSQRAVRGGELGVVVEAEVAEEGADDGAVLLLDAVVVVFAVGAGAGEPDVGVVGSEEGEEVVVEEFAAVVDVDNFGWEGELFEEVREGVCGGLGAAVPAGGEGAPLGGRVGDVEDPEEAFAHVAAAERDGVHLEDAVAPVSSRAPGPAGIWAASEALLPERLLGARRMWWGRRIRYIVEALMRVSSSASAGGTSWPSSS